MKHRLSTQSWMRDGRRFAGGAVALVALSLLGACASKGVSGYGVGAQAERAMMAQQSDKEAPPDTPGMYLGLIDQMQSQGLYFASLAHIDAYEKQYGASPDMTFDAVPSRGPAPPVSAFVWPCLAER